MKHTPGPWHYSNRNWRNEVDEHGYLYVTGDHHDAADEEEDGNPEAAAPACTGVCRVEGNATSGGVTEANARLIAAAPALLAAVHRLLAVEERLVAGEDQGQLLGSLSVQYQLGELRAEINELRRAYVAATEES